MIPLAEPYTWPISDTHERQYDNVLESYTPPAIVVPSP